MLDDAALFAASWVKSGVAGEGGATPLISRGLDPAPHGAGPAARRGRSPLVGTEEQDRSLQVCCCSLHDRRNLDSMCRMLASRYGSLAASTNDGGFSRGAIAYLGE